MLTREKLYYVEPKGEEDEESNNDDRNSEDEYANLSNADELHYGEMWFHGRLKVIILGFIYY